MKIISRLPKTNKPMKTRSIKTAVRCAVITALFAVVTGGQAAPYATDLTNSAGVVSFRLNEAADNVKIISSSGTVTNDLGGRARGLHVENLGVAVGTIKVQVTRSVTPGYTQSSTDGFQDQGIYVNKFEHPRGVVVDKNPASPSFGRIYVACGRQGNTGGSFVRTTFDGIYMLNADNTIALDTGVTPRTAGLPMTFGTVDTASPMRLNIGRNDNLLYICDFSDASGGLWVTDLDVATNSIATNVLSGIGGPSTPLFNHGSVIGAVAEGSLTGGDLKIFTIDEDLTPKRGVWRYDLNGGPYGNDVAGTFLTQSTSGNLTLDLAKGGANGYLYLSVNRSGGTDEPSIRVFTDTGVVITNSLEATTNYLANPAAADLLRNTIALDISPDGNTLALIRGSSFGRVWLVPLVNGVFNFAGTNSFAIGTSSDNHRDLAYDAAGNLYLVSSSGEWLRSFSRGGATVTTTGNDGTFELGTLPTVVTVAATTPTANEAGPVNGIFTISRAGDTSGVLTVNYTTAGTATSGSDYTALSGSVTFLSGATSTNVTVAILTDAEAELTETVILNLASGSYGIGTPASATVSILDSATPEISINPSGGTIADGAMTNLLESFADSKAVYTLTRKGLLTATPTVNLTYSGAAGSGVDLNGPSTVTFAAGAVTTNITLMPLTDNLVELPKAFTITVAAAGGYNPGSPAAVGGMVYSEDLASATSVFSDDFDTDTSINWTINQSSDFDSEAVFGYDYSAVGIPEAPHSSGVFTPTSGLRLRAHLGLSAITPGISVSPLNVSVTGDYRLRFDAWVNYNGPLDVGGAGSSQHISYGLGTVGNQAIWPGSGFADCVWFTASSEGDVSETSTAQADFGVFVGPGLQPAATSFYAAGIQTTNRGGSDPYYATFGGSVATEAQLLSYPSQTNTVRRGAIGMAWHAVTLTKSGDFVTWDIDGYRIASVDLIAAGITLADNVFLGFHDWFTSANGNPDITFALYDNVLIETVAAPIVITSIQLINGGTDVQVNFTAASAAVAGDFELHKSSTVNGTYANDAGALITGSAGSYQAVTAVSGPQQFYLIKKP
jgi:hypothetical protein